MKQFWILTLISLTLAACSSDSSSDVNLDDPKERIALDTEQKAKRIAELEAIVEADQAMENMSARKQLLVAYSEFANFNHQDDRTPEFLFRAGKLANELGKPRRAIEYLVDVHDGFPKYERKIEAAFLAAFIYENMLNDREMAEKYYELVLTEYPDSPWAADAKASIALLYLTDEEKIQKFLQDQQQAE